jgi:hypothetical protein
MKMTFCLKKVNLNRKILNKSLFETQMFKNIRVDMGEKGDIWK